MELLRQLINENDIIFGIIILIIFLICFLIIIISLFNFNNYIFTRCKQYINNIDQTTMTQIRSEFGKQIRYDLIHSLNLINKMKKYFGIGIICLFIGITIIGGFLVYQSKDYFKTLFDNERNKIELRSETAVDSLMNLTIDLKQKIDSVLIINNNLTQEITFKTSQISDLKKSNDNLNYMIKQQNQIIDEYAKKK
jgi:hypothetical protein